MAYIVRIELNSNQMLDFDLLHQEMEKRNFSKTIAGDNGAEYYLPKATYRITTIMDKKVVLESAKQAVSATHKNAEILVMDYKSCTWSGLKLVK